MERKHIDAIARCLFFHIPFIAYAEPGSDRLSFVASREAKEGGDGDFLISTFGKNNKVISINNDLTIDDVISVKTPKTLPEEIHPYHVSTGRLRHEMRVEAIVSRLQDQGEGKTVLCRAVAGVWDSQKLPEILLRLFESSDINTFRFVYWTHQTGGWLGASPELLLRSYPDGRLQTMALAGSRAAITGGEVWDKKNIEENRIVIDYIDDVLSSLGVRAMVGDAITVRHNAVEHICHEITGRRPNPRCAANNQEYERLFFRKAISALSPTPALAGYPLELALSDIEMLELHPRYCYGGYIAVKDVNGIYSAYVNLRSVHFDENRVCCYVGGGITAESKATDEWLETCIKLQTVQSILGDAAELDLPDD